MPTSHDIRRQFIDFFVQKHGHTFVPSSPVVPHNDPTLLFTNAGMNQFKPYFLGTETPPPEVGTRVANTQKCIRAGGKHNDLEDVGKDTYHHTFFEMLGNWSFGDYFKKESIAWGWELLTQVWGIDPERLHATYFQGDESEGLAPDDEAREIWLQYLPAERIHPGNKKDNFWEMGDTGPCGPCSEIHYDRTPRKSGASLVNADAQDDVVEIWNHVFIQFNRDAAGKLSPLPAKHIDTGMGFERITRILQGKTSNYDTDIFTPYFAAIQRATGAPPYTGSLTLPGDIAYRVIADHIRCLTFALADGAHCGNEGRNYVLRRILRRAVRYGRQTLGCHEPFFYKLVAVVAEQMGDFFPEVAKKRADVEAELREEEESFGKTLDRGIELFDHAAVKAIGYALARKYHGELTGGSDITDSQYVDIGYRWNIKKSAGPVYIDSDLDLGKFIKHQGLSDIEVSAEDAFKLHDTYGFPLDLTQLMAEERGMTVDVTGFNALMEQARERSRAPGSTGNLHEQLVSLVQQHNLPATEFLGYEMTECTRDVDIRVFELPGAGVGSKVAVVLSATPFYAESGGQVGDTGVIQIKNGARFTIIDTQKVGDVYFHIATPGTTNDKLPPPGVPTSVGMAVDKVRRAHIMSNHTTTHVMNRALRDLVNPDADQKGSLVDADKLRFDFAHGKAVTPEQVEAVEKQVNADIAADLPVFWGYAPQEKALQIHGLRAVFGEKYPPTVRVVAIGKPPEDLLKDPANPAWATLSIEFCGGTHLRSTGEARAFTIVSEEAVSKGVRRITALTGDKAKHAIAQGEALLKEVESLDAPDPAIEAALSGEVPLRIKPIVRAKLAELAAKQKEASKEAGKQQQAAVVEKAQAIAASASGGSGASGGVIVARLDDADANLLRTAMDVLRKRHESSAILLAGSTDGKVAIVAACPPEAVKAGLKAGDWVKQVAQLCGGGGGGKPEQAAAGGKDVTKINEALEAARAFASEKLN